MSILTGLRRLSAEIKREAKMPITEDIMKNELIAPFYKRKFAEGLVEGQLKVLMSQMKKRFGKSAAGNPKTARRSEFGRNHRGVASSARRASH